MRSMAVANQYQMSMDGVLRQFGTMASEMAVLGASGSSGSAAGSPLQSFSSTTEMVSGIRSTLPSAWTNFGSLVTSAVSVNHWTNTGTTIIGSPNLMNSPAAWRTLTTGNLRSSLLPPGQSFIGRAWGYNARISVRVDDNMSGIQTSWQKNAGSGTNTYITNARGVLYSNQISSFMTITEIPSQFGVQGQNLILTNRKASTRIGGAASRTNASTILGRTVDLDIAAANVAVNTKVVARGGIARRGGATWSDRVFGGNAGRATAAQAEAGSGVMTDLEEAGSAVLVNVGTRGKEIFRSPSDYENILDAAGRQGGGANTAGATRDEFLKYWLPYYQCNFRVTVTIDEPTKIRHNGSAAGSAAVSAVAFVTPDNIATPANRGSTVVFTNLGAPKGFGDTPTTAIKPEGKSSLHWLTGAGDERPINVLMRATSTQSAPAIGATAKTWVNTIDIDLDSFTRLLEGMPKPSAIPAAAWTNMPIALHVDIRGPGGAIISNAESVPVVIRRAKVLRRPVSIVTPGTIHIQGSFGSVSGVGTARPRPFSLFAPRVKYGMEGRMPSRVNLKGQRVGVGAGTNRQTDILSVVSGQTNTAGTPVEVRGGTTDVRLSNINVGAGGASQALPPVFLKDWLIETYNNF